MYFKQFAIILIGILLFGCSHKKSEKLFNTKWSSQPIGLSDNSGINIIELTFYNDSVHFDLPHGSVVDVSELLDGGLAGGMKVHYTWDYSATDTKIILDPGMTGYEVPLEISGDSLIWKGTLPLNKDYISFKRVN